LVVVVVVAGGLVVVVVVVTGWPDGLRGPVVVVATVVVVVGATVVVVVGATVVVVVGGHLPGGHHDEPWPPPQPLPPKRAPWVGHPQPGPFGSVVEVVRGAVVVTGFAVVGGAVVVTGFVVVGAAVVVTDFVVVGGAVVVTGFVVVGGAVVVTGLVVVGAAVVVTGSVVVGGAVVVVTGAVVLAVGGLEAVVSVVPPPPHVLPGFPFKPQPSLGPGLYWAANRAPLEAPTATVPPRLPCPQATAQASASAHQMPVASTSSTAAQRRGWALEMIPAVVTSPVRSHNAFRPPARYFGVRRWALRQPGRGRKPREYVTFSPYRYRQSAKILNF
jgi:hypothetical protein